MIKKNKYNDSISLKEKVQRKRQRNHFCNLDLKSERIKANSWARKSMITWFIMHDLSYINSEIILLTNQLFYWLEIITFRSVTNLLL